jgi:hypothetical protein
VGESGLTGSLADDYAPYEVDSASPSRYMTALVAAGTVIPCHGSRLRRAQTRRAMPKHFVNARVNAGWPLKPIS